MIKRTSILAVFILLICHSTVLAQNNILKGKILFQSSGNTPVKGIRVSAEGANSVISNSNGDFQLKFPTKNQGDKVNLNIGKDDGSGSKIELVNDSLIKYTRIPSNRNEILEVVVCKYGQLEENKKKYNGILETWLRKEYKKALLANDSLIILNKSNQSEIIRLNVQKDSINKAFELAKNEIEKQADFIARINLDNASARVKEALALINVEKDITRALTLLDPDIIDSDYQKARRIKEKADSAIMSSIQEYELRISLLYSKAAYSEIIALYSKITKIYVENNYDRRRLSSYYIQLATTYDLFGDNDNSLKNLFLALQIEEMLLRSNDNALAILYNDIGLAFKKRGEFSKAFDYLFKSLSILEKNFGAKSCSIVYIYNNIGITYDSNGEPEKALYYHSISLQIREKCLLQNDPVLVIGYNNFAMALEKLNRVDEALDYLAKAIKIIDNSKSDEYSLAATYNNISTCYLKINKPAEALKNSLYAASKLESINKYHTDLINCYYNIATSYWLLTKPDSTELYLEKSKEILDRLNYIHPSLIPVYLALGNVYIETKNEIKALEVLSLGLTYQGKTNISDTSIGEFYEFRGDAFIGLKKYDSSISNYRTALSYLTFNLFKYASLCRKIANIEYDEKHYELAIKYLFMAVDSEKKQSVPNIRNLAMDYRNISLNFLFLSNDNGIIENLEKSLTYFEKYLKGNDPDLLIYYNSLGLVYIKNKLLVKAKKLFIKLDSLVQNDFRNYRNWVAYYSLKNEKQKALKNLSFAIDLGLTDIQWLTEDGSLVNIRNTIEYKDLLNKMKKHVLLNDNLKN